MAIAKFTKLERFRCEKGCGTFTAEPGAKCPGCGGPATAVMQPTDVPEPVSPKPAEA